jgi:glyoxylase-like metal-dependent hydrolase (beta-lactamase superfamily II)
MMPRMRISCLSLLLVASLAHAEAPPSPTAQKLTERLYVIAGAGGNIAVQTGPDTTFLVDDGLQPLGAPIKAELAKVAKKPARFLVNTHWHSDHTGNNPELGREGVVIVAHDNVRKRLSTDQFIGLLNKKVEASPPIALPVVTFADSVTFHLNGDDVEVFHVDPAHTDGDSIVWFTRDDVVHMGDCFMSHSYPLVDISSGGNLEGFVKAADRVLARAKDTTRIIPGHGPIVGKAELKKWRDMVATIAAVAKKAVAEGKTLEQLQAMKPTAALDSTWGTGMIKPSMIVETAYQSFARKPPR